MKPLAELAPDWPEISRLLDQALDRPAAEREAWLAGQATLTAPVRDAVRALLAQQAAVETGDFLGTMPPLRRVPQPELESEPGPEPQGPAPGGLVGPWRILRELGQGGMGSVWLAERADGSLKRPVALKLPLLGWAQGLAERMARERDILATLEHPHIARLYDAGVDALGRPWLALEYVQGRPIDAYCRDMALPVARRVQLLLQVCAAVAYAHSRLVIHRDLKPGNILVGDDGQVRLLDFGIAKLLGGANGRAGETALTRAAGRALTLDYASPEQVRGEPLSTASDVYSLGVVAYELLAGTRPYKLRRGSAAELEEAIEQADIAPASKAADNPRLQAALRGDLDAILNLALKKSAAERYVTVDALAQDLRRHLAGRAVAARPDSLAYRLARLARRHRAPLLAAAVVVGAFGLAFGVGAAALTVLALLAGLAGALWQALLARAKAREANASAAHARAVQGFLQDIFRANSSRQSDPAKARQTSARELLDIGAQNLSTALQLQPAAQAEVALLLVDMYTELGLAEQGAELAERAVRWSEAAHGPDSEGVVRALCQLCYQLNHLGDRQDERRSAADRALAIVERRFNRRSSLRATVYRVVAQSRRGAEAQHYAALSVADAEACGTAEEARRSCEVAGQLHIAAAAYEAAAGCFERALQHHARQTSRFEAETVFIRTGLAECQWYLLDIALAEATMREAVRVAEVSMGATGLDAMQTRLRLGRILVTAGKLEEALREFDAVLAVVDGPQAPDPFTTPAVLAEKGVALNEAGRCEEAAVLLRRALTLAELMRPDSALAFAARERLALALFDAGQAGACGAELDTLEAARTRLGARPGDLVWDNLLWMRARLHAAAGRWSQARAALQGLRCLQPGQRLSLLGWKARLVALEVALGGGADDEVERLAAEIEALLQAQAARGEIPLIAAWAHALLAEVAALQGRPGAQQAHRARCAQALSARVPGGHPLWRRLGGVASSFDRASNAPGEQQSPLASAS